MKVDLRFHDYLQVPQEWKSRNDALRREWRRPQRDGLMSAAASLIAVRDILARKNEFVPRHRIRPSRVEFPSDRLVFDACDGESAAAPAAQCPLR